MFCEKMWIYISKLDQIDNGWEVLEEIFHLLKSLLRQIIGRLLGELDLISHCIDMDKKLMEFLWNLKIERLWSLMRRTERICWQKFLKFLGLGLWGNLVWLMGGILVLPSLCEKLYTMKICDENMEIRI